MKEIIEKYKYIGEDKFFINNGDIIEGYLTTWSVRTYNGRRIVNILYVKNAGFNGEDMPINSINLIEL